jgi:hypothetical protein
MGKIRIGKSINRFTVIKQNSLNMSNAVTAGAVIIKDTIQTICKILNLTFDIKKLNRIIDTKTAKITDLEGKLAFFYKICGIPSDILGASFELKAHSSQWFIDSNLLLAWVLWLYDDQIVTPERIEDTRTMLEKMTKQMAHELLVKQINEYLDS